MEEMKKLKVGRGEMGREEGMGKGPNGKGARWEGAK
jgi:hypothetical protein